MPPSAVCSQLSLSFVTASSAFRWTGVSPLAFLPGMGGWAALTPLLPAYEWRIARLSGCRLV